MDTIAQVVFILGFVLWIGGAVTAATIDNIRSKR